MSSLISVKNSFAAAQEVSCEAPGPVFERSSIGSAPLSFAQQQIWLHAQRAPDFPLYNEVLLLQRSGALGLHALNQSFREIIQRHEILRTTFPVRDGTPVQVVTEYEPADLPITDVSALAD